MRAPLDKVMTQTLPEPRFGGVGRLAVAPGRRLYVYERGTENEVSVWSQGAAGVERVQPLTADSDGRFPECWIDSPAALDLVSPDDDGPPTPWDVVTALDVDSSPDATVNTVTARAAAQPAGTEENGFVVKAPSDAWGDGTDYGTAQAFMLLRDDNPDETEPEPDRNVLFRVDGRDGGIGTGGGLHVAIGLRQHAGWDPPGTGAVWIQNFADVPALVINANNDGQTTPLVVIQDDERWLIEVDETGKLIANNSMEVRGSEGTDERVALGLGRDQDAPFGEVYLAVVADAADQIATSQPGDVTLNYAGAGTTKLRFGRGTVEKMSIGDTSIDTAVQILVNAGDASQVRIAEILPDVAGIQLGTAQDTGFYRTAANVLALNNDNAIEFDERAADIGAPGANRVRLYSKDNGAGKTQLVARFPTGAVQVIATEP